MGKRAGAGKTTSAKKAKAMDGWGALVMEQIIAIDADKGEHGAKEVCKWFGTDTGESFHKALDDAMCKFLQDQGSTAYVGVGDSRFPAGQTMAPIQIAFCSIAFKEPTESWPPLLDWKETAAIMLGMGFDKTMEPPQVYPIDNNVFGKKLKYGAVLVERGFSRLSSLAYILKFAFLDNAPENWSAEDMATLVRFLLEERPGEHNIVASSGSSCGGGCGCGGDGDVGGGAPMGATMGARRQLLILRCCCTLTTTSTSASQTTSAARTAAALLRILLLLVLLLLKLLQLLLQLLCFLILLLLLLLPLHYHFCPWFTTLGITIVITRVLCTVGCLYKHCHDQQCRTRVVGTRAVFSAGAVAVELLQLLLSLLLLLRAGGSGAGTVCATVVSSRL